MRQLIAVEFFEDIHWLGGSIYIDNLLAALSVLPTDARPRVQLLFLSSARSASAQRLLGHAVVDQALSRNASGRIRIAARRIHRGLARRCSWIGHVSSPGRAALYFPTFDAKQRWRRNLFWIPDFQPHYLPELFTPEELRLRRRSFREIADAHGILVLSSQAALADFRRFYPGATVQPRVWSFCSSVEAGTVDLCQQVLQRYALPDKFLYIANQFWRHKDHGTAFAALGILREQGIEIPLVCTGLQADRRDPGYVDALKKDLQARGLDTQVCFLGVVPRQHQVQLLRVAAAVVQPSRFEGWSTVIEDAKALGRPIIASNLPVHAEQLAGQLNSHLFRTSDAVDLADRIAALWPTIAAGPTPETEIAAAARRDAFRLESAKRFLAIVDEALAGA